MTTKEQKTISELYQLASVMRDQNEQFRLAMEAKVSAVEKRLEQKAFPHSMEEAVISAIRDNITTAIGGALTGYNSPLTKYAVNVVERYQESLESIFDSAVSEGIKSDEFRLRVREVLLHKIAKTMTSGVDGSIDKTVNLMKQDAVFRSRLTLAVNGLVEEFLNARK